jgi:hypothetical protein
MCEIGGMSPMDYLAFLRERAVKRRKEDAAREGVELNDPKRPGAQWRIYSTLSYAVTFGGKRYAGYSGTPGGMSHQKSEEDKSNVFMETDQAKRRLDRLQGIDPSKSFDPKKIGVPGLSGSSRPYCRCAEAAALSIAISKGETVDNLVFCAFTSPKYDDKPDCVFSPCPNCSMWLNRFAGGYFTRKTDQNKLLQAGKDTLAAKHMAPDTGRNRARRDSCDFIINPPRKVKDITFILDKEVYVLRCFKGAA